MHWLALSLMALAPPAVDPSIVEVEEVARTVLVLPLNTDDEKLKGEAAHKIAAGKHKVFVRNKKAKKEKTKDVTVRPGKTARVKIRF